MQIILEQTRDILSIRLAGELDHHAAKEVFDQFTALNAAIPHRCELDLSGLNFMDSSDIAVVLGLRKRLLSIGSALTVRGVPEQAFRVFRASGVDKLVKIERSQEATYETHK